ncbi:hypothetical protein, partial [Micromonospora sp. ATA51]|uniref:hypothetical protein n=1 Tax=Micromonospora sp. ATA51 TaxID=2806098 RepID=UPI001A64159B
MTVGAAEVARLGVRGRRTLPATPDPAPVGGVGDSPAGDAGAELSGVVDSSRLFWAAAPMVCGAPVVATPAPAFARYGGPPRSAPNAPTGTVAKVNATTAAA